MKSRAPRDSVAKQAAKVVVPFVAAALVWIVLSDLNPLRFSVNRREYMLYQLALDAAIAAAIIYSLYRTVHQLLAKNAAALGLRKEQLRAYLLITEVDSAIQRITDRAALLHEVCRLAVDVGGYRMTWYGSALDDADKTVRPDAVAGFDPGFVDAVKSVWSDAPRGQGPSGSCIRTGVVQIVRSMPDDAKLGPWREAALRAGYRSAASFPVFIGGRASGALTLCSEHANAFDAGESFLLERLAKSLAYGLENLDKVEAEQKLLAEMETLALAIDSSPVSVVITDPKGTIEFVNRKFTEMTGYSAAEAVGNNSRILKTGETSPEEYRRLWETISAGGNWKGVFHNRRKNGETFWEYALISSVKDAYGSIQHYLAIKEDLTEKLSLEQQLRQAQKMESLGSLAGGVAHDFNNLLTIIQGHCELLAACVPAPDGARESVEEIRVAAERAAALTKRLLQFGRKQPMRTRRVDVGQVAAESARMLARLIGENHTLELERPSRPLFAQADTGMIEQVLMNLALNARDAMPRGGKIVIAAEPSPDGAALPQGIAPSPLGFVRLSVRDEGSGIPAADLERIFEPFFTTKPVGKGTGLGLSVVDGIVRQHKGWVDVETAAGKGSTFSVHLPRLAETEPDAEAAEPRGRIAAAAGKERILIVEDEAPLRALAARGLGALGYAATEAASGPDALAAWKKAGGTFDLLVTDMVMPGGMNGVELARKLRLDKPGLRVVVMSGHHREFPLDASDSADGFSFLPKPFKPADLARAVRAELERA